MSRNNTNAVKGVFILLVIASHYYGGYGEISATVSDSFYLNFRNMMGQHIVAMFMFFSGYGVTEAVDYKGRDYAEKLPSKMLKLLVSYDIIVLIFSLLYIILGQTITIKKVVLTMLTVSTMEADNWYIFCILCMYFYSYLSFKLFPTRRKYRLILNTLLILIHVWIAYKMALQSWWYDTLMCYALGVWYSTLKKYVESFLKNNIIVYAIIICLVVVTYLVQPVRYNMMVTTVFSEIVFALLCFMVLTRIEIRNPILCFLGENLSGIFLAHRIPLYLMNRILDRPLNSGFEFLVCLVLAIIVGYFYNTIVINKINIILTRAIK